MSTIHIIDDKFMIGLVISVQKWLLCAAEMSMYVAIYTNTLVNKLYMSTYFVWFLLETCIVFHFAAIRYLLRIDRFSRATLA